MPVNYLKVKNPWWWWRIGSATDKKLIDRIVNRPAVEFYDLKKDPYELNNLANDPLYKKQIEKYTARLREWMKQQGDEGASIDINYKNETKED